MTHALPTTLKAKLSEKFWNWFEGRYTAWSRKGDSHLRIGNIRIWDSYALYSLQAMVLKVVTHLMNFRSSSSHVITRPRMLLLFPPRHVIPSTDYFFPMNTLHNTQSLGSNLFPIVHKMVLFKNFSHQISISLSVDVARKWQPSLNCFVRNFLAI